MKYAVEAQSIGLLLLLILPAAVLPSLPDSVGRD